MRIRRTDLAMEAKELWQESAEKTTTLRGVKAVDKVVQDIEVTTVQILDEVGEQALGKPQGSYVTLKLDGVSRREQDIFTRAVHTIASELSTLLRDVPQSGMALVVGLGNRAITPDAIGPKAHENILVTRHLVQQMPEHFGNMRAVASLAAEVLGSTGVESGEVVRAVCEKINPACVVVVDALASRSLKRLCRTVQLSDTGIVPGSGVGNHRIALNKDTLGVPVIAVGVPTVVEGATLAADLMGADELPDLGEGRDLLVTPKDIDAQVAELSKIIGYGISLALQPEMDIADLDMLLS